MVVGCSTTISEQPSVKHQLTVLETTTKPERTKPVTRPTATIATKKSKSNTFRGKVTKKVKRQPLSEQEIIDLIYKAARKHGVDPFFAMAVASVESRLPGRNKFRCGPIGRGTYYGPFGLHKCFLKRWDISDPVVNIEIGVRSLKPRKGETLKHRMRRYNLAFNEGYWRTIKKLTRQFEQSYLPLERREYTSVLQHKTLE